MFQKLLFLVSIALTLIFGLAGTALAQAEEPNLAIENQWSYSVHFSMGEFAGEIDEGFQNATLTGLVQMEIVAREIVEILNHTYEVWIVEMTGEFEVFFSYDVPNLGIVQITAPAHSMGYVYLDSESFKYVRADLEITSRFRQFSFLFDLQIDVEMSVDVQNDTWTFPFDVGSQGVVTGNALTYAHYVFKVNGGVVAEDTRGSAHVYDADYDCTEWMNVRVGDREYEAYVLNISTPGIYSFFGLETGHRIEYYASDLRGPARVYVHDSGGERIGEWSLISFRVSRDKSTGGMEFLLAGLILLLLLVLGTILVRRRSKIRGAEGFDGVQNCRRCGAEIGQDETTCPKCGRAIW